jgi:hypothetical protein
MINEGTLRAVRVNRVCGIRVRESVLNTDFRGALSVTKI